MDGQLGEEGDTFGSSVSINGDHAVVGARKDDDNGVGSGSAYIFVNNHNGSWSQQDKITAGDGEAEEEGAGEIPDDAPQANRQEEHQDHLQANKVKVKNDIFAAV